MILREEVPVPDFETPDWDMDDDAEGDLCSLFDEKLKGADQEEEDSSTLLEVSMDLRRYCLTTRSGAARGDPERKIRKMKSINDEDVDRVVICRKLYARNNKLPEYIEDEKFIEFQWRDILTLALEGIIPQHKVERNWGSVWRTAKIACL